MRLRHAILWLWPGSCPEHARFVSPCSLPCRSLHSLRASKRNSLRNCPRPPPHRPVNRRRLERPSRLRLLAGQTSCPLPRLPPMLSLQAGHCRVLPRTSPARLSNCDSRSGALLQRSLTGGNGTTIPGPVSCGSPSSRSDGPTIRTSPRWRRECPSRRQRDSGSSGHGHHRKTVRLRLFHRPGRQVKQLPPAPLRFPARTLPLPSSLARGHLAQDNAETGPTPTPASMTLRKCLAEAASG